MTNRKHPVRLTIALWVLLAIFTGGVCAAVFALINWFPELYAE